jgi:hypothetical protein
MTPVGPGGRFLGYCRHGQWSPPPIPFWAGSMFSRRPNCRLALTWTRAGSLRFPGDPPCAFASVHDPGRTDDPSPIDGFVDTPPRERRRGLQLDENFGAIAGLQHLLPTLHEWCCHHPCKACFRPAGSPLPGGSRTLWIAMKGFRSYSRHPLPGLILTQRSPLSILPAEIIAPTFPQRSPPSLLTTAACGGLGSAT